MRTTLIAVAALLFAFSDGFSLSAIRVASGLKRPCFLAAPPGDSSRVVILEQYTGKIMLMKRGAIVADPFLDLGDKIETSGNEQGLLGLAFHPEYSVNGYFFLNYSRKGDGATVISRFTAHPDRDHADPSSEKLILIFDQPYSNHNGGHLLFGPDGMLWIGTGDGGAAEDPGNRAQNLSQWLGKMLRIDVNKDVGYNIPPDNPFWNVAGARPEIWAYGLRNPWRYCFDSDGNFYIADVGQYEWEEIHIVNAREKKQRNFGWRIMEGKHCFNPPQDCDQTGLEIPQWEYDHQTGCSITGGEVYYGQAIPELQGHYLFADYCTNRIWSFRFRSGGVTDFKDCTSELEPKDGSDIMNISSFGRDASGELYILDHLEGEVFKLIP